MAVHERVEAAITDFLSYQNVRSLFDTMGSSLDNHLSHSAYQAYLQVITWLVLDKLKTHQIIVTEEEITPLVDRTIKPMCTVREDFIDYVPSFILSRVTWSLLKLSRNQL